MGAREELIDVQAIAAKEFYDYFRSKRFILLGILYAMLALAILGITVLSLNYDRGMGVAADFLPSQVLGTMDILNIILVLLAVVLTADTVSAERRDRTIYQLLSKPVSRESVILGKFIGCLAVMVLLYSATAAISYALAAVAAGVAPTGADLLNALLVIAFMVLMFAVYVAMGLLISTATRNPLVSILGAIIAWVVLFFSNAIGTLAGVLSQVGGGTAISDDVFSSYPAYAKLLVWIDPLSHDIVAPLLTGAAVKSGLPLWVNVAVLLAFTGLLLLAAFVLFRRMDI